MSEVFVPIFSRQCPASFIDVRLGQFLPLLGIEIILSYHAIRAYGR